MSTYLSCYLPRVQFDGSYTDQWRTPLVDHWMPFINRGTLDLEALKPVDTFEMHFRSDQMRRRAWGTCRRFHRFAFDEGANDMHFRFDGNFAGQTKIFGALSAKTGVNLFVYWLVQPLINESPCEYGSITFYPGVRKRRVEVTQDIHQAMEMDTPWYQPIPLALLHNIPFAGNLWSLDGDVPEIILQTNMRSLVREWNDRRGWAPRDAV